MSVSFDETCTEDDLNALLKSINAEQASELTDVISSDYLRNDVVLTQNVFHAYHSETEMMRYLRKLSDKDIALDRAMIPLGSCTMKLNAATEMTPVTWPEFSSIHPFAPLDQTQGYRQMISQLEEMLCACTGYDDVLATQCWITRRICRLTCNQGLS